MESESEHNFATNVCVVCLNLRSFLESMPRGVQIVVQTQGFWTSSKSKEFLCITHADENNYISPSSSLGIQLYVSALYFVLLQVDLTYGAAVQDVWGVLLNRNLKVANI